MKVENGSGGIAMDTAREITTGVHIVGGPEITDPADCCVFLVDGGTQLALIDTGAGPSAPTLIDNIESLGLDPSGIRKAVLTHCHIDHSGGAAYIRRELGVEVLAHHLSREYLERGDPVMTAADLYGLDLEPVPVDTRLSNGDSIRVGELTLHVLHTPGHTPDSISLYLDSADKRVLFGQDIHGPFAPQFGSDLDAWRRSMERLLELEADVLCEGHFGIYRPSGEVRAYIEGYLARMGSDP